MNHHSYCRRSRRAGPRSLPEEAPEGRFRLRRVAPRRGVDAERGEDLGALSPAPARGEQEEVGGAPRHGVDETERLGEQARRGGRGEKRGEAARQPERGETAAGGKVTGRGAKEVGRRARHLVP